MKRNKYHFSSFALSEAIISLVVYSLIILLILSSFELIAKTSVINLNYAYLHQIRLKLLLANEIKLFNHQQLLIDHETLICQNNQLYLVPGYQLFQDKIDCVFSLNENSIYLNIDYQIYWIGEYYEN